MSQLNYVQSKNVSSVQWLHHDHNRSILIRKSVHWAKQLLTTKLYFTQKRSNQQEIFYLIVWNLSINKNRQLHFCSKSDITEKLSQKNARRRYYIWCDFPRMHKTP